MARRSTPPRRPEPLKAGLSPADRLAELYAPLRFIPTCPESLVGPGFPLGYKPRQPRLSSPQFARWQLLHGRLTPLLAIPVLEDAAQRGYTDCGVFLYMDVPVAGAGLDSTELDLWRDASSIRIVGSCHRYAISLMLEACSSSRDLPEPDVFTDSSSLEPDWIRLPPSQAQADGCSPPILALNQPFMLAVFRSALELKQVAVWPRYRKLYSALHQEFETRLLSQEDWLSHLQILHSQVLQLAGELEREPQRRKSKYTGLQVKCYELWRDNRDWTIEKLRETLLEDLASEQAPGLSTVGEWRQKFELGFVPLPEDGGE